MKAERGNYECGVVERSSWKDRRKKVHVRPVSYTGSGEDGNGMCQWRNGGIWRECRAVEDQTGTEGQSGGGYCNIWYRLCT